MKKLLCMLCVLALAVGMIPAARAAENMTAGGWFESLYAQIPGVTDSQVTAVSYSGAMSGSLTGDDLTYLVRDMEGGVRIDIPGLKAGTYSLSVTAGGKQYTASDIQVMAYDRSGYAHWKYTDGVGAYKDDGTLKANALVLYVTNENKEMVKFTSSKGTITGIGKILNNASANNSTFMALFDTDKRPLVVRFVGNVTTPTGLTEPNYYLDSEGEWDGDNGSMAMIKNGANVTLEGIGADATIDGWGFDWGINSSAYGKNKNLGKNFEVRNLSFRNAPEDCASAGGADVSTAPVEHIWIHNCAFYVPSVPDTPVADKHEGDGAVDFKRGSYLTMSYNYFEGYHKTNLVGSSDSVEQYHITWHHNWWKNCESRGPLGRKANMHIYNNIYEGQTSYCMSLRANCYIFSEYNSFINCNDPVRDEGSGGVCKSYQDTFTNCKGRKEMTIVTAKTKAVTSANKYANFDTNSSLSYIPSGDYELNEDVSIAKANIDAYAGPMKPADAVVTPGHTHVWSNWQTTKAATCTQAGVQTRTCSAADCPVGTQTQSIPALDHAWDNGKVTKEPTCTEAGERTYTCTRSGCNATKTSVLAALGHNYEDRICTRCGSRQIGKTYVLTGNQVFADLATNPVKNLTLGSNNSYKDSYTATAATSGTGGTDDFFTLLYSQNSRLDPDEKAFSDGFQGTHRINFQGAASTTNNAIRFETYGSATVKVWWVGAVAANEITSAKQPRPMVILDETGKEAANPSETVSDNTTPMISTFALDDPGVYYLGGKGGKNFIFKVEVTVVTEADPPRPDAVSWGSLEGKDGGKLPWVYTESDELIVTGTLAADETVLVGCYDDRGRLIGAKLITASELSAQLESDIPTVKLFWLSGEREPMCESVSAKTAQA